ncbi:saccharopine dehydrogenase-like oxidoreductase isoform X2 [Dinothrombium tinctorium]|uniref:Saccharopine dehydrogenase-like oxidoreductase isoform X2 n=1 Tax=Dinothrombium tinctorium TaxID=1965070 RepID=A0A3S3PXT2_9ACAR|nr:saccharopine dehydrogenase-like oxidoreductase isoform X2 [Dinothrombium tinctorium]
MEREFDLIIFGATGYTGRYCIEYMVKCLQNEARSYKWAVAGRSEYKVRRAKDEVSKLIENDLSSIPVIVADVKDEQSLENMCRRCKVLLNCVGPYRDYGEPVTKACIQTSTHQVDVAGEPQYTEKMQLLYFKDAENANVYIVNCCGFGIIPFDMGVHYLEDKFKPGHVNSVEAFIDIDSYAGNHGSWDSVIGILAHRDELIATRKKLHTEFYGSVSPNFKYPLKTTILPFISYKLKRLCIPCFYPSDDVQRTQLFNHIYFGQKPIQFMSYMTIAKFLYVVLLALSALFVVFFSRFKYGVKLLKKYPHLFTFGAVSKTGPTRDQVIDSHFKLTLIGHGWSEEGANENEDINDPPDRKIVAVIKGQNSPYISTAICLIVSAFTILEESANFPLKGGVITPGVAFRNSKIIERLNRNSVKFEIVES